jgi:hypothetical protein
MQIQRSAPDGHPRDCPVTAANAKRENRGEVGAIMIDERKDHIRKGRLLGEGSSDLSHAQMFRWFFPLCTFEPSLPNRRKDFKIKQSPLTDLRAGCSCRGHSEERSEKEAAQAGSSPSQTVHGHIPMKSEKRLLCDLCRNAQTCLRCQRCGVHSGTLQLVCNACLAHGTRGGGHSNRHGQAKTV